MAMERKLAIAFGVLLVGMGLAPIAVAAGWIDTTTYAPNWGLVAGGLVFLLPGIMCLTGRFPHLILLTFGVFAVLPTWIAFGPGPRDFDVGIALGPIAFEGRGMEVAGRLFFGVWSVLLVGAFLKVCYDELAGASDASLEGGLEVSKTP